MNAQELNNKLYSKFEAQLFVEWQQIEIIAIVESNISEYSYSYVNKDGESIYMSPSEFRLDKDDYNAIKEFLQYLNIVEGIKCNKLIFKLFPNKDYEYDSAWDEDKHQHNIRYSEAIKKSSKAPKTVKLNASFEQNKMNYKLFNGDLPDLKRVLMLDISRAKMIGTFYTRLFSVFGSTEYQVYEGFSYFITDKKNDIIIGAELTASGLGYHAANESKRTIEALNNFHSFLFSPELEFVDTELTIDNDFGMLKIGCQNGVVYEFQIEN